MIVVGCFIIHSYSNGSAFTFGVLMIYLLDDFQVGEFTVGWIGALQVVFYLIIGKFWIRANLK